MQSEVLLEAVPRIHIHTAVVSIGSLRHRIQTVHVGNTKSKVVECPVGVTQAILGDLVLPAYTIRYADDTTRYCPVKTHNSNVW